MPEGTSGGGLGGIRTHGLPISLAHGTASLTSEQALDRRWL